jgi:hypothetical protein
MPTYRIELARTVIESGTLCIEADSEEAAKEQAMNIAEAIYLGSQPPFRWSGEALNDTEIMKIELAVRSKE